MIHSGSRSLTIPGELRCWSTRIGGYALPKIRSALLRLLYLLLPRNPMPRGLRLLLSKFPTLALSRTSRQAVKVVVKSGSCQAQSILLCSTKRSWRRSGLRPGKFGVRLGSQGDLQSLGRNWRERKSSRTRSRESSSVWTSMPSVSFLCGLLVYDND